MVETRVIRPITNEKLNSFCSSLDFCDWSIFLLFDSAEEMFHCFIHTFLSLFNDCFPTKFKTKNWPNSIKKSFPDWSTDKLRTLKNWVLLAYDFYKVQKTPETRLRYLKLKKEYKLMLRQAKMDHNVHIIESSSNSCSAAWKVIRKECGPTKHRHTTVEPDVFNNYFVDSTQQARSSIDTPNDSYLQYLRNVPVDIQPGFDFMPVSCAQVQSVIHRLKNTKSRDVYDISNSLVKKVSGCVILPLTYCINMCIQQGIFPQMLKTAKVIPVHKKGGWEAPDNFRPISLLPIFSKIFETLLKNQIYDYFESNSLLSAAQFGFRAGLSTIDAVEKLTDVILDGFSAGGYTGVTLCDLSKAFDTVDHSVLCSKLEHYGVHGKALELMRSYLSGREQFVYVNGRSSQSLRLEYGVPQGSVLGPLLFIIMINDLSYNLSAGVICYADDTTLFDVHSDISTLNLAVDQSLTLASNWFKANFFLLNNQKTQSIIFTLRQITETTENVGSVKLLGMDLDSKLNWKNHITSVCSRLSRIIFLLRNLRECVPVTYVRTAYIAFFQSTVLYGLKLWGCAPGVDAILLLQKKAIRIVSGAGYFDHCKPIFIAESLMTVYSLFVFLSLCEVKDRQDGLELRSDIHGHYTRNRHNVNIPFSRLRKVQSSYRILRYNMFNHIPLAARSLPNSKFKAAVRGFLLAHPLYSIQEYFDVPVATLSKFLY